LWQLGGDGKSASLAKTFRGRAGEVSVLGGNPQTRQVVFDQGPELRLLSMPNGRTDGVLRNPGGRLNVPGIAPFSPDANLHPANEASETCFQPWRRPRGEPPPYESRQLVWPGSPFPCGASAPATKDKPQGDFVVTGTEDQQVVIWEMPSEKEITAELDAEI